jgi:hypothetical protein
MEPFFGFFGPFSLTFAGWVLSMLRAGFDVVFVIYRDLVEFFR